ncbi:hypothetical protein [Streptomyces sp. NPDC002187]|uniref:hypothetical protein n=1 Tax=Streptomyces sp. NPDC002187 TaxID=3364637 RepID=UPI0036CA645A
MAQRKEKEAKAKKRKIRKKRQPKLTSMGDINDAERQRTCTPAVHSATAGLRGRSERCSNS